MKNKIELKLESIDAQIAQAIVRHDDLISMLCDQKCMLTMALSSPDEINSVDEIVVDQKSVVEPNPDILIGQL